MRGVAAVIIAGIACALPANAQEDGLPAVSCPSLSLSASKIEGFVPKGWVIEKKIEGDLNGDAKPDVSILLCDKDPHNIVSDQTSGQAPFDTNPRMLVAALAERDGSYRLALENHTLIPRPDNPSQEDPMSESGGIALERGSLVVGFYFFMSAGGTDSGTWS